MIMQQDLIHLKSNISTHTNLIKGLVDGVDLETESDETTDVTLQASECSGISRLIELEAHVYEFSNTLDTLIHENNIADALEIIKLEDENLQRLKDEEDYPFDIVMLYDCVISDKNARIKLRLAHESENTKTPVGGEIVPTMDRPPSTSSSTAYQVSEEEV